MVICIRESIIVINTLLNVYYSAGRPEHLPGGLCIWREMNEENLKRFGKEKEAPSSEEAVRNGIKGGLASVEARKERKLIKDRILERMGESDWDEMIDNLVKRAKKSVRDFESLRDTIGEKPTEVIEVQKPTGEAVEEMRAYLRAKYEAEGNTEPDT